MKNIVLFIWVLITFNIQCQQPSLDWGTYLGSNGIDQSFGIIIDNNENVLTCGNFAGSTDFNPSATSYMLSPVGSSHGAYVQKLDPNGNFIWAVGYSGTNDVWANSIAVDSDNNVYITGYFQGTIDFDPGIGTFNLTPSGFSDAYILKLDQSGNFLWAQKVGGTNEDAGVELAVDNNNDVIIYGDYSNTADFDPSGLTYSLTATDGTASFIWKINSSGNFIWAKSINSDADGITVNNNNEIYITGIYTGTVDFDPNGGVFNLSSISGTADVYILKLNSIGDFQFAKSVGGSTQEVGGDICLDNSNNVYITAGFSGTADFDPSGSSYNLTSFGDFDNIILKLDPIGNFSWVARSGSTSGDFGNSIYSDDYGNVFATGCFTGTVDFDHGIGTYNLSSNGAYDIFVLKINSSGIFKWAISMGGSTVSDMGNAIIISNISNSIYTTGNYGGIIDLDPGAGNFNTASYSSEYDCFLQKLIDCTSFSTIVVESCESYTAPDSQIYNTSGNYTAIIPNAAACDSIITISLTINQNTSSSISPSSCGSYSAPDGQIYTTGGNYIAIIPNAAGCDSSISINLTILTIPTISAGVDQTVCEGTTVTLSGSGGVVYNWDNGVMNGVAFTPPVGNNIYTVTGMASNGCTNTNQVTVLVNPLPAVSFSIDITLGCSPLSTIITNTTPNSTNCVWTMSDGSVLTGCGSVINTWNQTGCYDISLTTSDLNGCLNTFTGTDVVCVETTPIAAFTASPNSFSEPNEQIIFTNNSTGATSYSWDFGDLSTNSTDVNPTHIYQDGVLGSYVVELIAISNMGCSDTAYITIFNTSIEDSVDIPNGFSPNNDNENDTWTVIGLDKYPNAIINVFNRWGQLLFEGNQANSTWNGIYQGEILPTADYYYIVDLGNGTKFNGVVTLKQ